ncbi:MAG TPA: wax ester/triacylglycerol synthase domain-containing protein, partial [Gemmatimonadales bacterium]|nr:wax ester/triacylglycerol synthase domain-containing protein [Gemmatimonadales bacterium]
MTTSARRLSDLDALLLAAETPTQPLHVMAAVVLENDSGAGRWNYEIFQSRIAERFRQIEPLQKRPVWGSMGRPILVDDPSVAVQDHLHHITLPDAGGIDALGEAVGAIASEPL